MTKEIQEPVTAAETHSANNHNNATDTRSMVNEFFRRVAGWDADGTRELFADEIDWYVPVAGDLPWGGRRTRPEQVPEYFKTMWSHFRTEKSQVQLDHLIVEGEEAVALGTFTHVANTTERQFSTPFALHFTVKDGRIFRVHLYEDTYAVGKAFGI